MIAVLLLPAIPVLAIGGVVITSDTPLVCCWTWAAVWTYRAVRTDELRAWIAAGLIGALGVWAKYSFLAFPASVGLFLLLSPAHRRSLSGPASGRCRCCARMGLAPILIWNARHGWAGAGQLADRVGLSSRATWASIWPVLTFLGGDVRRAGRSLVDRGNGRRSQRQSAQVIRDTQGPALRSETDEPDVASDSGLIYLLCLWGVIWTACLAASLLGETEANWMVPGYISLVILIGMRVGPGLCAAVARGNGSTRPAWCLCLPRSSRSITWSGFIPSSPDYVPEPTERWPVPLRVYEPTARMRGHQVLARAVAGARGGAQGQGRVAVCLDANLRPGLDALVLPARPARDLLPELELRDDAQASQPARPLASQPASRPGCVSGSGGDCGGRRQHAA